MQIVFNLSDVFYPGSNQDEDAYVLRSLLDALISIDMAYLRNHATLPLYRAGVVYGRTQEWERIPDVMLRGYADCKSLTAWRVAELRHKDLKANPVFRWRVRNDGSNVKDFHILVQTTTGFEDPSRLLGMGNSEWSHMKGTRK